MFCPNCGEKLTKNQKFCAFCGEQITFTAKVNKEEITNNKEITREEDLEVKENTKETSVSQNSANKSSTSKNSEKVNANSKSSQKKQEGIITKVKDFLPFLMLILLAIISLTIGGILSIDDSEDVSKNPLDYYNPGAMSVLQWPENELTNKLPVPESQFGYVGKKESNEVWVYVGKVDKDDFKDYKMACKGKGYTNIVSESDNILKAKDDMGNRLILQLYSSEKLMIIAVKGPLMEVDIEIECEENLIFSRYNLKIEIDGESIGNLKHGKTQSFSTKLGKGEHTLKIISADDSSVYGEEKITIRGTEKLRYKVSCYMSEVEINAVGKKTVPISVDEINNKSYLEVKNMFTEAGFTNIKLNEIKDLTVNDVARLNVTSNITIDGLNDFEKGSQFYKEVEIVIEYHTYKDITLPKSEGDYIGKNYSEVKKEFEELGFANIEVICTETTNSDYVQDTVGTVWIADKTFVTGNTYSPTEKVTIKYWEVKKIPVVETKYERAFIRKLSNYSLYYMFDEDTKEVVYFGTNDTSAMKGTYSGNFSQGVDISWERYEAGWHETLTCKEGSTKATLIDYYGDDWAYVVCDVIEAQKVLNSLEN